MNRDITLKCLQKAKKQMENPEFICKDCGSYKFQYFINGDYTCHCVIKELIESLEDLRNLK